MDSTVKKVVEFCMFVICILFILYLFLAHLVQQGKADLSTQIQYQKDIRSLTDLVDHTVARGVVVYDLNSGTILAAKNIDQKYSLASLTKIVTATLVYEKDKNKLNEIRAMLKVSDNAEADRLATIFGADTDTQAYYMNQRVKVFDLYFRNASGLDTEDGFPGGEGKPVNILNVIKYAYLNYPEMFDQTIKPDGNTNAIVNNLSFLSGSKTGFTFLSGGNLFVTIQKGLNREIIILVLNSTEESRFVDVQHIADFLLQSSI